LISFVCAVAPAAIAAGGRRRRRLSTSSPSPSFPTAGSLSDAVDADRQPLARVQHGTPRGGDDAERVYFGLRLVTWVQIGVIAAIFIALFWPNLRRLWGKTNPFTGEANWGHAICIPIIGLYYLYTNRDELLKQPVRTGWTGLPIALFGILFYAYAIWPGQNDMFKDLGMVITLFGVVLLLSGWSVMKIAWFPIAYLVCGIPWPGLLYSLVASPLQHLAAWVAVVVLRLTGVDAHNYGTKIDIPDASGMLHPLNVAEACAGLRSLMTFITVGAAVAFLSVRPLWQKITITLSAIPIAVFCNTMRVAVLGLLHRYWSQVFAEGFAHQFVGIFMLVPAFFLILLVGWVLDNLFIEEADDVEVAAATGKGAAVKGTSGQTTSGTAMQPRAAASASIQIPRHSLTPARTKPSRQTPKEGA
jgi:exosortase